MNKVQGKHRCALYIVILSLYTGVIIHTEEIEGALNHSHRTRALQDLLRVNRLVPTSLRKECKAVALASDKTLTDYINEAMQHQINRTKKAEIPTT